MKTLNVRWRLTLWYGAVLAAIVIAFSTCVYAMMHRHLLARADFELDEELTELALEVRLAQDDADLEVQLARRFFQHGSFDFQVGRSGHPSLFRSERLQDQELAPPVDELAEDSPLTRNESVFLPKLGEMRVASRRARRVGGDYLVQAAMSLSPTRAELRAMLLMLLAAGPIAIAAALVGGYYLARHSLAPVEQMATFAEQVTGSRLDSRIAIINAHDELGHLARVINSMLDRINRSMEELRRFTADAAHELRTPLAVMQTEAEVALRVPRSAEEYQRVIEITLDESRRLAGLTDRLLTLSRFDCGLPETRSEEVPLHALAVDVADRLRGHAEDKQVSIEVEMRQELTILGDDVQLSQLLFNLLDNAVKFTRPGGKVFVEGKLHDGQVSLTISDTGVGISAADLPHVFQRFYRADKSRSSDTGGVGLGLAICQAIAKSHRGQIVISSHVDTGTSVQLTFPCTDSIE